MGLDRLNRFASYSSVARSIILAWAILLAATMSSAWGQSQGDYDLNMRVDAPGVVSVVFRIPAQFPSPSQLVTIGFRCDGGTATLEASRTFSDGRTDFAAARDFIAASPDFSFDGLTLRIQEYGVRCSEGTRLTFFGPTFADAVELLWGAWDNTGIGSTFMPTSLLRLAGYGAAMAKVFEFRAQSGYRYPNIREGFFKHSVHVYVTDREMVAGADIGWDRSYIVALSQGGSLVPLLFEAEQHVQAYDASRPALISVARGSGHEGLWDKLEIEYGAGSFTWWRDDVPPR